MLAGLKQVDNEGMTLEEARRTVDRMSQEKKDAVNEIISGKVQPLQRCSIKEASRKGESFIRRIYSCFLSFQ